MNFPELEYVSVEDFILKLAHNRSVLHLGCAGDHLKYGPDGCLHYRISKVSSELHGVEIDLPSLNTIKKYVPEDKHGRIKYHHADVQNLDSLTGKRFEVILAASIIEHLSNPGMMLAAIKPLCLPETKVIIVTPHVFGMLQFIRVAISRKEAVHPQHTCWFSISTLSELCARYSFEAERWLTGYGWKPPSIKWTLQKSIGTNFFNMFPHLGGSLLGVFHCKNK
jgi:2-polyprenyl-3-methyl-5-hydroxy-6-metoxy-1,4-benzoquinol methylase